jgi:hypothetical protein
MAIQDWQKDYDSQRYRQMIVSEYGLNNIETVIKDMEQLYEARQNQEPCRGVRASGS